MTNWVSLPGGYVHDGVKRVFVRGSVDDGSYLNDLAVAAVRQQVAEHHRLFAMVDKVDEAELEMVVVGQSGVAGTSSGTAVGLGPVAIGGSKGGGVSTTDLAIVVTRRLGGQVIYENRVFVSRHPNTGMDVAAARILKEYSRGR